MLNKKITLPLALVASLSAANAAVINWGAATAVSTAVGNSTDVSVNGIVHHAIVGESGSPEGQLASNPQVVNGVSFTQVIGGSANNNYDAWSAGNSGDAAYDALLSHNNFDLGGSSATITLGDGSALGGAALVDGQQYEIQVWYVEDRTGSNLDQRFMRFGDGEAAESTVEVNDQYAIGTFTASGTTQTLTIVGGASSGSAPGQAHLGALQVRNVTVPEPSSTALLGLGGLAWILRRRK